MAKKSKDKLTRIRNLLGHHRIGDKGTTQINSHGTPPHLNSPIAPCVNVPSSTTLLPCPPRAPGATELTFPHAIVKQSYTAQQSDEMTVHEFELVALLCRMDENWYYACSLDRKKVGLIPRNFIDIRVDVVNSSNFKYSSANPEIPSRPAETEIPQTQTVEKALKLREPSDVFCKVLQEFESQTDEDLSAKLDEIILWVDEEAEKGRLIPEDWIKCMNLAGKVGTFPGNLVVALTSDAEIDEALTRSPHAIALKEFTSNEDDLVPVNFGEAVFIDKVADGFIFGRTASGHIGKIPLEICKMAGSAF